MSKHISQKHSRTDVVEVEMEEMEMEEEEEIVDGPHANTSARRYRTGEYLEEAPLSIEQVPTFRAQRLQRNAHSSGASRRQTVQTKQQITTAQQRQGERDDRWGSQALTRSADQRVTRQTDQVMEKSASRRQASLGLRLKRWWNSCHWLFHLGVCMCSLLIAWTIGINAFAWFVNSTLDPITAMQTPYWTRIQLPKGHVEYVHAFIDPDQQHIDALCLTDADRSRPHLFQSSLMENLPEQHVLITVHGSVDATGQFVATIQVRGPLVQNVLGLDRSSQVDWTIEGSQQGQHDH